MTGARGRPACPWTGRSRAAPARTSRPARRVRRAPGVVRRCRSRSRPRRLRGSQPAAPRRRPDRAVCSACRRLRARVPGRDPAARAGAATACCSRSRPPPTCTRGPATVDPVGTGMAAGEVARDGVVDLPGADSLFQRVGAARGRAAAAPPDNVVLLPAAPSSIRRARRGHAAGARRPGTACCPAARAPPTRRSPGGPATWRRSSPARGIVGDNSGTDARPGALATRSTRSCCSCSSACPGRSSPGW